MRRNKNYGRKDNNRRGRGRPHHRGRRNPTQAAESGNLRERIAVESGHLVMIDQFMLANQQFISSIQEVIDEDPSKKDQIVRKFGGDVVDLDPGTYRIARDPFKFTIVVHPEETEFDQETLDKESSSAEGTVYVDTRCLAMIDRELLDDSELLVKYQELWFAGQDKACRDLIRDNGGAVRYGFNRHGDELGVHKLDDCVCLWPDVG